MIKNSELNSDSKDSVLFIEKMSIILRQCGVIAIQLQGDVSNTGKSVKKRNSDSERLQRMRQAKTNIDGIIQDNILIGMEELSTKYNFAIDAEEETLFNPTPEDHMLKKNIIVIDPIDGTLEYLEGKDDYSICVAWHCDGEMKAAMVFFPARDVLYFCTTENSYMVEGFLIDGLSAIKKIEPPPVSNSSLIYYNNRAPREMVSELQESGYTLISDEHEQIGVPDVLLSCIVGATFCYLSYTRQIRDILLGVIIEKMNNGSATDWLGKELGWPESSRLPRGVFSCSENVSDIHYIIKKYN